MPVATLEVVCPDCTGELTPEPGGLTCRGCGAAWAVAGGVPVLTSSSTWYPKEHMTREQFEAFLGDVARRGWDPALETAVAGMDKPRTFRALAFDHARRDLSAILPVSREAVVLDYGCGVGGIAFGLAQSCKHVYAIDQSLFRARFVHERARSTGVRNVTAVCAGNSRHLPFPDESFDIVVVNGVLEWMPLASDGDPRAIQLAALREMHRVMRTGGVLYLSIENRFGYRYVILGKGDSHNQAKRKLRYVTALPRALADAYSRMAIGHPYRCYLYSYAGYRRILGDAGFSACAFHFPYPDHNTLTYIVPLEDGAATARSLEHILGHVALSRRERWALGALRATRLVKYLAQDYAIVATK